MKTIITLISIGYIFTWGIFLNKIFKDSDFCSSENTSDLAILSAELEKSASYDFSCTFTQAKVVQSGCWFWDLFLIKSYKIQTLDGYQTRVFTREAIPNEGEIIEVRGVFRQLSRNAYLDWFGLVEYQRKYLNN